jgi:PadR family transcriptional regulator, regulatory protein PadR
MAKRGDHLAGVLDLLILKSVGYCPNHGFGITLHIQTVSDGLLRVEEGSLYPALHRLERETLIKGQWKVTENGRRARFYSLTTQGKRKLAEIESNWGVLSNGMQKFLRFA